MPPEIKQLLNTSLFDQAYFLYLHALEYSWSLIVDLKKYFRKYFDVKFRGSIKSNLKRIVQQFNETVILGET